MCLSSSRICLAVPWSFLMIEKCLVSSKDMSTSLSDVSLMELELIPHTIQCLIGDDSKAPKSKDFAFVLSSVVYGLTDFSSVSLDSYEKHVSFIWQVLFQIELCFKLLHYGSQMLLFLLICKRECAKTPVLLHWLHAGAMTTVPKHIFQCSPELPGTAWTSAGTFFSFPKWFPSQVKSRGHVQTRHYVLSLHSAHFWLCVLAKTPESHRGHFNLTLLRMLQEPITIFLVHCELSALFTLWSIALPLQL